MKWTIPSSLFVLVCSVPIYSYLTFTNWGLLFGNLAEVVALLFASYNYLNLLSYYDRNHPLRSVWPPLALGAFTWLLGQCLEIYCEMVLRLIAYGTVADALWVLGYLPLIYGFHRILVYRMEKKNLEWRSFRGIFGLGAILYAAMFMTLILPQLGDSAQPFSQTILDFCYPTLDFVLILQCVLLLKISKRGDEFHQFSLLSMFAFCLTLVGDGILSLISDFQSFVYLSVDAYYFACYFLMAIAAYQHSRRLEKSVARIA